MKKSIGAAILVSLAVIAFITPARNYLNNLVHKGDRGNAGEREVIGTISGYNPRVKEIQEILKDTGLYSADVDGLMGVKTREAIKKFQAEEGLEPSGKIDPPTMLALNRAEEATRPPLKPGSADSDLSINPGRPGNLPEKQPRPDARQVKKVSEVQDEVLSYRLKSKDRIKQIQTALKKAGFYKSDIDGKTGLQTKTAIKAFQKSKGLTADGIVGQRTWDELSKYLKN